MSSFELFVFIIVVLGVCFLYSELKNEYPHDPRCDELIRYLLDQADDLKVRYEYDYMETNYLRVVDSKGFTYYFYVYEFDDYLYRCTKESTSGVIYSMVQPSRWLQLLFWWKIERRARHMPWKDSFIQGDEK